MIQFPLQIGSAEFFPEDSWQSLPLVDCVLQTKKIEMPIRKQWVVWTQLEGTFSKDERWQFYQSKNDKD